MKNILVVGSINMDLVIKTDKQPKMGETILGYDFMSSLGGKGANQAVACAKLGGKVKMLGCVGKDLFGEKCRQGLLSYGVDVLNVFEKETATGVAVITVFEGDNSIIVDSGANKMVTAELIENNAQVFEWAEIVLLQLEIPFEAVFATAKKAKELGKWVIFNPAPMTAFDFEILKYIDLLVVNEFEAAQMLKIDSVDKSNAKNSLSMLLTLGLKNVMITLGKDGCFYNEGESILYCPVYDIKVVDTTAAGDSFIAGVSLYFEGVIKKEAVFFATAVSAITVSRSGASVSIPTKSEVEDFLAKRVDKI
jgi:ribokinase